MTEPRIEHQSKPNENQPSAAADLLRSAAYSFAQKPIEGAVQIVSETFSTNYEAPIVVSRPLHQNNWTVAGDMLGSIGQFYVGSKVMSGATGKFFKSTPTLKTLEIGATGAICEGLTPLTTDKDFGINKAKQVAHGFTTFIAMDGAARGLRSLSAFKGTPTLLSETKLGLSSGGLAGVASFGVDSLLYGKELSADRFVKEVGSHAIFGGGLSALSHGVGVGGRALVEKLDERIASGKPLLSIGPLEIHSRDYTKRMEALASTDYLTGLKNKRTGAETLDTEIARAKRTEQPLSVAYLDVNDFTAVNEVFKHRKADRVLQELASGLRVVFKRKADVVARDGGDEVLAIMPNTTGQQAERLAGLIADVRVGVSKTAVKPAELRENFITNVAGLQKLSRTDTGLPGETLTDVATRAIRERMRMSGEQLTPKTIEQEVARLGKRNGLSESDQVGGKQLSMYDDAELAKLGEGAAFRFLPQLGQLLKSRGIATEKQVQEALAIQKEKPGSLIGQILEQNGVATKSQIESVLAEQQELRQALRREFQDFFKAVSDRLSMRVDRTVNLSSAEIAQLRSSIPEVLRPQLDPMGVRPLQRNEPPTAGEREVGFSIGTATYQPGDSPISLVTRADEAMYGMKRLGAN